MESETRLRADTMLVSHSNTASLSFVLHNRTKKTRQEHKWALWLWVVCILNLIPFVFPLFSWWTRVLCGNDRINHTTRTRIESNKSVDAEAKAECESLCEASKDVHCSYRSGYITMADIEYV
jgi:hypothetical protein